MTVPHPTPDDQTAASLDEVAQIWAADPVLEALACATRHAKTEQQKDLLEAVLVEDASTLLDLLMDHMADDVLKEPFGSAVLKLSSSQASEDLLRVWSDFGIKADSQLDPDCKEPLSFTWGGWSAAFLDRRPDGALEKLEDMGWIIPEQCLGATTKGFGGATASCMALLVCDPADIPHWVQSLSWGGNHPDRAKRRRPDAPGLLRLPNEVSFALFLCKRMERLNKVDDVMLERTRAMLEGWMAQVAPTILPDDRWLSIAAAPVTGQWTFDTYHGLEILPRLICPQSVPNTPQTQQALHRALHAREWTWFSALALHPTWPLAHIASALPIVAAECADRPTEDNVGALMALVGRLNKDCPEAVANIPADLMPPNRIDVIQQRLMKPHHAQALVLAVSAAPASVPRPALRM